MSCTSSLIAVDVAPGVQAYIAVAVVQVGACPIIFILVHSQLERAACCSAGAYVDFAALTPAL